MGDGRQLFPPVWWRGSRQHQKEARHASDFANDCLYGYLLGWQPGIRGQACHDHGLVWKIMHGDQDSSFLCPCLVGAACSAEPSRFTQTLNSLKVVLQVFPFQVQLTIPKR